MRFGQGVAGGQARFARVLGFAETRKVPALTCRAQNDRERAGGCPQRRRVKQVPASRKTGKQRLARPERRQQRRDRRLQGGKESGESGRDSTRSSRSGLMKRSNNTMLPAKTRPISIRMSRARLAGKMFTSRSVVPVPIATGMTQNGRDREQRRHVEHARRASRDANAEQHRQQEDQDHPGGLEHGLRESGVEKPPNGDRRRQQEPQIFGQEESRQRSDDPTEGEKR